jgi:hypothetical protein
MIIPIFHGTTGEQIKLDVPDDHAVLSVLRPRPTLRSLASVHVLAAMLAHPKFEPPRQEGETTEQAYARRACDFVDALLAELQKRTDKAGAEAGKDGAR